MPALPPITDRAVELVRLATRIRSGELVPGAAVQQLSAVFSNSNSARGYLSAVRSMLDGREYQRRLKLADTKNIVDAIGDQHGPSGMVAAIAAVRKHISYYERAGGNGQPSLLAYCDLLQAKLPSDNDFEARVRASAKLTDDQRRKLLPKAGHKPELTLRTVSVYKRSADVVAHVLHRAAGRCEACKCPAPFLRRSDGTPYLEVHHRTTLADGGDDTVENAVALCPNCHRARHYGPLE